MTTGGLKVQYKTSDGEHPPVGLPNQYSHVPRVGETIKTDSGEELVIRWIDWSQEEYDLMIITL